MTQSVQVSHSHRVNLRSIALPAEHGGWGFLLEPVLLGLCLAPTLAGLLFGVTMLAVFLMHQPLRIMLKDVQKRRWSERGKWALRFTLLYGSIAWISGLSLLGQRTDFLVIVLLMLPMLLLQAVYDYRSESRALLAELAGAGALGGIASAVVMLAGWSLLPASALWILLLGRTLPSIIYVRAKLRGQRGEDVNGYAVYLLHGAAIVVVALLAWADWLPWLSVVSMVILLARAWLSLRDTQAVKASRIGFQEIAMGLCVVALTVAGSLTEIQGRWG
jgi:hypothetical protein